MQRSAAVHRNKLIDLNLLPAGLRPRSYPRWYVLGLTAVLTGCVLLVPALAIQHSAAQETTRLRDELTLITSQLESAGLDIGQERGLRTQIEQAEQAVAALQAERASLPGASGPLSKDLTLLYSAAPAGMSIAATSRSEKDVTVSGDATSIESVIAYARTLNQGGSFDDVTIIETTGGAPAMKFAVRMAQ